MAAPGIQFSIVRRAGPRSRNKPARRVGQDHRAKNDGLKATGDIVGQNLESDVDTYVNVNNHYEGSAPLTIRRLLEILRQESSQ